MSEQETRRVRWLLEFDPDFPGPEQLRAAGLADAQELALGTPWAPRWPEVTWPALAYGTMRTLRRLQSYAPLAPLVFDRYPALRWTSFWPHVHDLLGREVLLAPLGALPQLDLRRHFGERVFVRPETNYKLFASEVVPTGEIERFVGMQAEHRTELVMLSEVVALGQEYRCFCREGRVFAHSSYPEIPYHPAPPDVIAFAERCAGRLHAALSLRMITVDVARAADGRLRLVEIGGVNSWGVYGCDLASFVAAMEAEAREVWAERGSG